MTFDCTIRPAVVADVPALLELMRGLAVFERYIDVFAMTPETVATQGFARTPPDFHAIVADADGVLCGMVVFHVIRFTATGRPIYFIKELFVAAPARSGGVGRRLMQAVASLALQAGAGAVKWQVAPWNADGIRFYERLGARADRAWVDYGLDAAAIAALAAGAHGPTP